MVAHLNYTDTNIHFNVPYLHHTSGTMLRLALTTNPNPSQVLDVWCKQGTLKRTFTQLCASARFSV